MGDRIEDCREKLRARPADTLTRYVLAKELFDRAAFEESIEEFGECVRLKPDWMKCWIHLGQSLKALGQPAEARAAFGEALRLARIQDHTGPAAEIERELSSLG